MMKKDLKLLAGAVVVVVMKILNVDDRIYNRVFEATALVEETAAKNLNQFSAIIFDFVKQ